MRHRHHAVGVQLAAFVDRNIFAEDKTLVGEVMSDLVGRIGIVECPAAAAVSQQAVLVVLVRPQSRDATRLVMLALQPGVDPVVGIERRNEDIGMAGVTLGVAGFACKLDTCLLYTSRCV